MTPLLLDTCALIWSGFGQRLRPGVQQRLTAAGSAGALFVSPVGAWEIGLLHQKPIERGGLRLTPDAKTWLQRVLHQPIFRLAPLTAEVAVDAAFLPGELHRDPADRLLAATARDMGAALVTRDARLLAYAEAGHLQVLAC